MNRHQSKSKWPDRALQAALGVFLVLLLIAAGLEGTTSRVEAAARQKFEIRTLYQPIGEKGDYRLSIYGGQNLVCEEQPLRLIDPGQVAGGEPDIDPIIIECRHPEAEKARVR